MAATLSVRPHVGRGLAAIVLARATGDVARDLSTRPDVAWAATTQPLQRATGERNALLSKSGYEAPVATASGALPLGRRVSVPVDLKAPAGSCARIDVVAGAPPAPSPAAPSGPAGARGGRARGAR